MNASRNSYSLGAGTYEWLAAYMRLYDRAREFPGPPPQPCNARSTVMVPVNAHAQCCADAGNSEPHDAQPSGAEPSGAESNGSRFIGPLGLDSRIHSITDCGMR